MSSSSRQIKRLTQAVKHLRGLNRLPNAASRPFGTAPAKDAKQVARQEAHDRKWSTTPDKAMVRFFTQVATVDETRRSR